jgi:hypothetical protein
VLAYNSDSYEYDFGLDPIEPEPNYNSGSSDEMPLLGPALGLFIKSTPTGRFFYWLDHKPADLASVDASRFIANLETLLFQEGALLSPIAEECTPTEVDASRSCCYSPNR